MAWLRRRSAIRLSKLAGRIPYRAVLILFSAEMGPFRTAQNPVDVDEAAF